MTYTDNLKNQSTSFILNLALQIRCGTALFLIDQSKLFKKLQGHVVSRDQKVLPADTNSPGRMQK